MKFLPPFISGRTAMAIYPYIYLPETIYSKITTGGLNADLELVIEHELKHLERQREVGLFRWLLKYCIDKNFRFEEELVAVKASVELSRKIGVKMDIDKISKILSGPMYLWMTSYSNAYKRLSQY